MIHGYRYAPGMALEPAGFGLSVPPEAVRLLA